HPGRDVYGQAPHPLASELDLAGMDARPHTKIERLEGLADAARTADGPSRSVEGSEEAVAGRVDLASAKACQLPTDSGVVLAEDVADVGVNSLPEVVGHGSRTDRRPPEPLVHIACTLVEDRARTEYSVVFRRGGQPVLRRPLHDGSHHLLGRCPRVVGGLGHA